MERTNDMPESTETDKTVIPLFKWLHPHWKMAVNTRVSPSVVSRAGFTADYDGKLNEIWETIV
jgi:hypothetical protein